MSYIVTVPLAVVRDGKGTSHHFYRGGVVGFDSEHVKHLVEEGALVKVEESPGPDATDTAKAPTADAILAEVGDDPEKAAAALDLEQAAGDAARSTLVKKLQAVIDKRK